LSAVQNRLAVSVLCGLRLGFFCGFAAAAALGGAAGGGLTDQFGGPNRGDKLLYAVAIEINGSALGRRLGNGANAILLVTNSLAF
jgi:hypothetical protein